MIDDHNPSQQVPIVTFSLICVNVVAFLVTILHPNFESIVWEHGLIAQQFQFQDVITSMFLHADVLHLLFNMIFLWVFGDNVEEKLGPGLFLLFYFLGGIFADIIYWTTARHAGTLIPSIGASGAISAVLGFYMIYFPGAKVSIFTEFGECEFEAFTYFSIWFVGEFIMFVLGGQGVNYVAHMAGFIFGIFFATSIQRRQKS